MEKNKINKILEYKNDINRLNKIKNVFINIIRI